MIIGFQKYEILQKIVVFFYCEWGEHNK